MMKQIKGMTLVEVMVTLLFVAFSMLALIRFQNYMAYDNSLTQQRADAILLAESQIESDSDYQVLNNLSGYTSYQGISSSTRSVAGSTTTYTVTSTVTAYTNPTYKRIDVTVSWVDTRGSTQSVQQIGYISSLDPQNSAAII